ncbi:MAG: acyl carrier protein [Candidatus Rokubacteria bacterium]|nr:acyl carrier protein [Candidatus Rokubacteria bacterium]
METKDVVEELRGIFVNRLRFDPARAAAIEPETPLPKGVDGGVGLDSLDFIELSIAIEERFGIVMDESQDLAPHFASLQTLSRFVVARVAGT